MSFFRLRIYLNLREVLKYFACRLGSDSEPSTYLIRTSDLELIIISASGQ
jgi:hypothetical protein